MTYVARRLGLVFSAFFLVLTIRIAMLENKTNVQYINMLINGGLAATSLVASNKMHRDAIRIRNLELSAKNRDSVLDVCYKKRSELENDIASLELKLQHMESKSIHIQSRKLDELIKRTSEAKQDENAQRKIVQDLITQAEKMTGL